MATPAQITGRVQSLMNDQVGAVYFLAVVLPYLNMALDELQEEFELNNIPSTNETSDVITVPAGTSAIGFDTVPALPANLIEIQELWQSVEDQNEWTQLARREYLPHDLDIPDAPLNWFLYWSWMDQEIRVQAASVALDLKIDYIKSIFAEQTAADANIDIPVINSYSYLSFKTAALCARFIGEDIPRSDRLEGEAEKSKYRTLQTAIKGRQAIPTRRRPFRASYKNRGFIV